MKNLFKFGKKSPRQNNVALNGSEHPFDDEKRDDPDSDFDEAYLK